MQVRITRTTVANKQFVREGSVVELDESEARLLIAIGKAEAIGVDEPASETVGEDLTTETADAVVEAPTPKAKRRAK